MNDCIWDYHMRRLDRLIDSSERRKPYEKRGWWSLGTFIVATLVMVVYQYITGDNISEWPKLVFGGAYIFLMFTLISLFIFDWREINREEKADTKQMVYPINKPHGQSTFHD